MAYFTEKKAAPKRGG
jgi:predicted nucleotidyltransferase